jgi:hypothetical protein
MKYDEMWYNLFMQSEKNPLWNPQDPITLPQSFPAGNAGVGQNP